jgi:hypothetical protein
LNEYPRVPEDVWTSIALTTCLDRLRVLNITSSDGMSDALLLPILNKCRNSLKELRFGANSEITAASAAPIGECSELEVLFLKNRSHSPWPANDDTISRLPEIVEGLPKLRECDFCSSFSWLTNEGVIGLAMSCPDIEVLTLACCQRISDAALTSLVQCRALKKLDIRGNDQLTDAAFASLSEGCWPKMEFLNLMGLCGLSEGSFVSLARACPSLVEVVFHNTNVTDEAVWTLCQRCPSIFGLYFLDCPNVTDRSLVAISEHLPSLTALYCAESLEARVRSWGSGAARAHESTITDDGIEKLVAKCHFIKTLLIGGCRSTSDRSVLQITDHCPALELLDVAGNDRITAVSLEALGAKCLKLEKVNTRSLRQESMDSLRLHFPCIHWDFEMGKEDYVFEEDSDEEEEDQDQEEEEQE